MNKKTLILCGVVITVAIIIVVYFLTRKKRENYEHLPNPMSLMLWNPHYECFRNKCCGSIANKFILDNIVNRNVDFANLILPPGHFPVRPIRHLNSALFHP